MMNRSFHALAAIAGLAALTAQSPAPAPTDEAAQLFARSGAQVANLKSYTSALHVDFGLRTFPYLKFHVEGDTAFVRPDDFSVHFKHVPWFAKGFEHIKMDAIEPQNWPQRYIVDSVTHQGDRTVIEMRDKIAGNVKNVRAEFDASGLRRVEWSYTNGGRITVDLNPVNVDGVFVPASESADIRVPGYHVEAHATFTDYAVVKDSRPSGGETASNSTAP
ncbi:MAG TPA: hypothetical protein VMA36_15075 [Candidatus Limnocylindria bacterium]|jgi:hypothetical protein|nr:hypothetical protein [Candidatus Limnocylindria bacterium]